MRVPLFLVLSLVVRGTPALLLYRRDFPRYKLVPLALFSGGPGRGGHALGPAVPDVRADAAPAGVPAAPGQDHASGAPGGRVSSRAIAPQRPGGPTGIIVCPYLALKPMSGT